MLQKPILLKWSSPVCRTPGRRNAACARPVPQPRCTRRRVWSRRRSSIAAWGSRRDVGRSIACRPARSRWDRRGADGRRSRRSRPGARGQRARLGSRSPRSRPGLSCGRTPGSRSRALAPPAGARDMIWWSADAGAIWIRFNLQG